MPRKRKQKEPIHEHYVVRVSDWEYSYGLSPGVGHFESRAYSEIQTLTFEGDLYRPADTKYSKGKITLSGDVDLLSHDLDDAPTIIGTVNGRDDLLDFYIFIPAERLSELVTIASTGDVKVIAMGGEKLKWRKGRILSLHLSTEFDEDEY